MDLTTPQAARGRVDLTTPQQKHVGPREIKSVDRTLLGKPRATLGPFQHPTMLDPSVVPAMASPEGRSSSLLRRYKTCRTPRGRRCCSSSRRPSATRCSSATERLDVAAGGMLLLPDQPLEYLYIVLNGTLQLELNGRSVGSISKGQSIELLGVLGGGRSSFAVRADEPVSLLRISANTLREVIARDPEGLAARRAHARVARRSAVSPAAARLRRVS